jgi:hypothetical protein
MTITEYRLRRLFADRGFRVREIRCNRHWWCKVERESGGPTFGVAVSVTPSVAHFEQLFDKTLRRAERAAAART